MLFGATAKTSVAYVALAITPMTVTAQRGLPPECNKSRVGHQYDYDIWVGNINDIPGLCGGLWDNLKGFGECALLSHTYCGGDPNSRLLNWKFEAASICNPGMVESAWWGATKNNFGALHCPRG